MKRGAPSREKGSSKRSNDKPASGDDASIDVKSENNGAESDNNNVDVKVEPGTQEFVNCKEENGESSPAMDISEQNDEAEGIKGDESDKGDNGVTTNGGSSLHFSLPTLTKRSVTLQMLLAAGILKPGEGTMSLEYHGQKFVGDLLENGQIKSQETSQIFTSPSAWAIACKQIINPEKIQRKSGCGWASIKYRSLKLDYYKTVWFKRVREGSIDIGNISNGATSSSDDSEDEGLPHCVLKYGDHFESSPPYQSAILSGAKVLISCCEFKEMDRLQPFHVKIAAEALCLADLHSNITNTETVGYISGQWSGDQNVLKLEVAHPCHILMPLSSSTDCDNERNRIALEIQRLGHDVVGWYHSHPKAPPFPSKDDINRQLDYQVMMKGASESSYIPCIGLILSPTCYGNQEMKRSKLQAFWVMPPPENRPMEMGRPMNLEYDIVPPSNLDPKKLLVRLEPVLNFYKEHNTLLDVNDLGGGRFDRLKESVSTWIPDLKGNSDFWNEARHLFTSPLPANPSVPKNSREDPLPSNGNSLEISLALKQEDTDSSKTPSSVPEASPPHFSSDPPGPSVSILPNSGSTSASTSRSVSTPSSTGDEPVAP